MVGQQPGPQGRGVLHTRPQQIRRIPQGVARHGRRQRRREESFRHLRREYEHGLAAVRKRIAAVLQGGQLGDAPADAYAHREQPPGGMVPRGGPEEYREQQPRAERRAQECYGVGVGGAQGHDAPGERARDREKEECQPREVLFLSEGDEAQPHTDGAFDGGRRQERPAGEPRRRRVQAAHAGRRRAVSKARRRARQPRRDEQ